MDFFVGPYVVTKGDEGAYQVEETGWYELRPSFHGTDRFGPITWELFTDQYGNRSDRTYVEDVSDYVFLGDSFTYGVAASWGDTFVGMFADESGQGANNAGVASYSPTPYLYRATQLIEAGVIRSGSKVIVGIDISDVQDEATRWVSSESDAEAPTQMVFVRDATGRGFVEELEEFVENNLPVTTKLLEIVARASNRNDMEETQSSHVISSFTYANWDELDVKASTRTGSFWPLGVEGGLQKIEQQIGSIADLVSGAGGELYLLVYPWPAQLYFPDSFGWSEYAEGICRNTSCQGVIDVTPEFLSRVSLEKDWYDRYFIYGDVHYNKEGNRIVADALLDYFGHSTTK